MSLYITTQTLEYVFVPVTVDGGAPDPGLAVEVAIPTYGTAPSTWVPATWDDGRARVLVGTGGDFTLAKGQYHMWIRVSSSPELTARLVGSLVVV